MDISKKIQQIRQQKNLTQDQVAKDLAVSRQAVSKWESGKAIPDVENLMYISNLYDISLDELIKGDDSVGQKLIADANAKKWYKLNIIFFVLLLVNILWLGAFHGIWQAALGIAVVSMIIISIRMLVRNRMSKFLKM